MGSWLFGGHKRRCGCLSPAETAAVLTRAMQLCFAVVLAAVVTNYSIAFCLHVFVGMGFGGGCFGLCCKQGAESGSRLLLVAHGDM
jgi:hypothetical protein